MAWVLLMIIAAFTGLNLRDVEEMGLLRLREGERCRISDGLRAKRRFHLRDLVFPRPGDRVGHRHGLSPPVDADQFLQARHGNLQNGLPSCPKPGRLQTTRRAGRASPAGYSFLVFHEQFASFVVRW
jgi:hypothetical protein